MKSYTSFAILFSFFVFIVSGCSNTTTTDNSESTTTTINTTTNNTVNEASKSDVEIITNATVDLGKEILKQKKINDSIRLANRESKWVYKIGHVMDNEKSALEFCAKLKNIPGISIFKKSRKEFIVFKNDERPENELRNSRDQFKAEIASVTDNVEIIDLMEPCGKREKVKETDELTDRKGKVHAACYECSK